MRMAAHYSQDQKEQYSNNEEESPDYLLLRVTVTLILGPRY